MLDDDHRTTLRHRRIVVKLGTGILTSPSGDMDQSVIDGLSDQFARLKANGIEVIVVSSGAVGLGMGRMKLDQRPNDLPTLQACAAVGQSKLIETWQKSLKSYGLAAAQILLTHDDLREKRRHVSVRESIEKMLTLNVVPIINENDCISVDELKFGDNDVLSALVASLLKADLLFILSTIPGFMNLETGQVIPVVEALTDQVYELAKGTDSPTARGGMRSKLKAVEIATGSSCGVFIASGRESDIISKLIKGGAVGTFFPPSDADRKSHKRWIAYFNRASGNIIIDDGALEAIVNGGTSLLAKGATAVEGNFEPDSVVNILDSTGKVVGKGRSPHSSEFIQEVLGMSNHDILDRNPQVKQPELIHRDDLALI